MRNGTVVLLLLVAGCGVLSPKSKEHRVRTQDEAGSVHLAVLSVAPWEKYKAHLQPAFSLTTTEALDKVLAISGATFSKQTESSSTKVSVTAGPGATDTTADAPDVPGDSTTADDKEFTPKADPMTEYAAATALYQEVQLLNRYIQDAAIRKKGYKAYVLRLQITLLPRARNEPYDAYTNISFFVSDVDEGTSSRGTDSIPERAEVLPLLVTDNLQASLASSTRESIRALAGSLGISGPSASGTLGAAKTSGELDTTAGLDLNSLLTVARMSGNTLRVRLGAMQQGSVGYAMIPRSHAVTVLAMVKEDQKHLSLVSRTTMVDVKNGVELPQRSKDDVDQLVLRAGEPYEIDDLKLLHNLLGKAQTNNVAGFYAALNEWEAERNVVVPFKTTLWLDLVSLRSGGQYNFVVVDLDTPASAAPDVVLPASSAAVAVEDDGKACTLTLPAAPGLVAGRLKAVLIIDDGDETPCEVAIADGKIRVYYKGTFVGRKRRHAGVRLELTQGKAFATYRSFKKRK